MNRFPTLKFLVTYGSLAAHGIAVFLAISIVWLGWSGMGWPILIFAVVVSILSYVVVKSFVELVILITEMLLPQ